MKVWLATNQQGVTEIVESRERPKMLSEGGPYGVTSPAYDSRDELIINNIIHTTPCKECGGVITLNWIGNVGDLLKQKTLCFNCNHWHGIIDDIHNPRRVIVKGAVYFRKDYRDLPSHLQHVLGYSGSVFHIEMNTGDRYKTNDLWCNGEIPERFKDRLPDNAKFYKP